jgi:hypothetical protein
LETSIPALKQNCHPDPRFAQLRLGAPFKPFFGLSGIPQRSMLLFCH